MKIKLIRTLPTSFLQIERFVQKFLISRLFPNVSHILQMLYNVMLNFKVIFKSDLGLEDMDEG